MNVKDDTGNTLYTKYYENVKQEGTKTYRKMLGTDVYSDLSYNPKSNIGVDTVPYNNWQVVHNQYPVEKVALHSQAELLHNQKRKCKVTTLGLGYVDTEFNKEYDGAKLSYENIIDTIKWIIDQPFEIKQMMVSAK